MKRLIRRMRLFNRRTRYETFDSGTPNFFDEFIKYRMNSPTRVAVLEYLERDFHEPFSLLDIGCGPGLFAAMLFEHPNLNSSVAYTGIDQSEAAISYCQTKYTGGNARFLKMDILDVLPAEHFDVVVVNDVLEHISSYAILDNLFNLARRACFVTTFGVLPTVKKDIIKFSHSAGCYLNVYAFKQFYDTMRQYTFTRQESSLTLLDLGDYEPADYPHTTTYSMKTRLIFYAKLR